MRGVSVFALSLLGVSALAASTARGDIIYSSSVFAYPSYDYYGSTSPSNTAHGTGSASLDVSLAGPNGGTYAFSGSAVSSANSWGVYASTTLTSYGLGSYMAIKTPGAIYLAGTGSAYADSYDDSAIIAGEDGAVFSLDLTYRLSGNVSISAPADAGARSLYPTYIFSSSISGEGFFSNQQAGLALPGGSYSNEITLHFDGIPANTPFGLYQLLIGENDIYESYNVTDINPFDSTPFDFDPSHITGTGSNITDNPYSAAWTTDFIHTLQLVSAVGVDGSGNTAFLTSGNDISYPTGVATPEPSTLVEAFGGLLTLSAVALYYRRRQAAA